MRRRARQQWNWLAAQARHTASVSRLHGLKAAAGDRLAAGVAKSPQAAARRSDLDAALGLLAELAARFDALTERVRDFDGVHPQLGSIDTELRRLGPTAIAVTQLASAVETLSARVATLEAARHDGHAVMLDWLWNAHAPLAAHPLITAIIPTGLIGREQYLRSAIDSVLGQTYAHWELLVVDDGVPPLLDPLPHWWPDDPRVSIVTSGGGNGGAARNLALTRATGEIAAYLDDDCRWYPWWLHAVAAAYAGDPELDVAYGIRLVEPLPGEHPLALSNPYNEIMLQLVNAVDTNVLTHRLGRFAVTWPTTATCDDYELALSLAGRHSRHIAVPAVNYATSSPSRTWVPERHEANEIQRQKVVDMARAARPLRIVALVPSGAASERGDNDPLWELEQRGMVVTRTADALAESIAVGSPDVVWLQPTDELAEHAQVCAAAGVPWALVGSAGCAAGDPFCMAVYQGPAPVDWADSVIYSLTEWSISRDTAPAGAAHRWWQRT